MGEVEIQDINKIRDIPKNSWLSVGSGSLAWYVDSYDNTIYAIILATSVIFLNTSLIALTEVLWGMLITKAIGTFIFGSYSDKLGRKKLMIFSFVWITIFTALTGLSFNIYSFFLLRILYGIGFGATWSVSAAYAIERFPAKFRGMGSGIMMFGFDFAFFSVAVVSGILLSFADGWRLVWFTGIVPGLIGTVIALRTKESELWNKQGAKKESLATVMKSLFQKRYRKITIITFLFMAAINLNAWALWILYPTFLETVRHVATSDIYLYIGAWTIGSIIGKPLLGQLSERFRRDRVITFSMIIAVILAPFWVTLAVPAELFIIIFFMGLIPNGVWGLLPAYIGERYPTEMRGSGEGLGWLATSFSGFSPFIIAYLRPAYGFGNSIMLMIIATAIPTLILALINGESKFRGKSLSKITAEEEEIVQRSKPVIMGAGKL